MGKSLRPSTKQDTQTANQHAKFLNLNDNQENVHLNHKEANCDGDACNPSSLGGPDRRTAWGQEFEISLHNVVKPCLYLKFKT